MASKCLAKPIWNSTGHLVTWRLGWTFRPPQAKQSTPPPSLLVNGLQSCSSSPTADAHCGPCIICMCFLMPLGCIHCPHNKQLFLSSFTPTSGAAASKIFPCRTLSVSAAFCKGGRVGTSVFDASGEAASLATAALLSKGVSWGSAVASGWSPGMANLTGQA